MYLTTLKVHSDIVKPQRRMTLWSKNAWPGKLLHCQTAIGFIYYLPFWNHGVMDNEGIHITSMDKRPGRSAWSCKLNIWIEPKKKECSYKIWISLSLIDYDIEWITFDLKNRANFISVHLEREEVKLTVHWTGEYFN